MKRETQAKIAAAAAMAIFGTIGLFRRWIDMPSGALALVRALIGSAMLLAPVAFAKKKPDMRAVRGNMGRLCLSGACLGGNWILLFEAYNHTSVAVATLCYQMGPVLVLALAPLLFGERLGGRRALCAGAALAGAALASGAFGGGNAASMQGTALALGAAALYAGVMLCNRKIRGIEPLPRTLMQLLAAAAVMLPYVLATGELAGLRLDARSLALLPVVGILHTGAAYALYFGALGALSAQTAALLSYIDPALAVLLSAFVLREPMGAPQIVGALLVLGATLAGELPGRKKA